MSQGHINTLWPKKKEEEKYGFAVVRFEEVAYTGQAANLSREWSIQYNITASKGVESTIIMKKVSLEMSGELQCFYSLLKHNLEKKSICFWVWLNPSSLFFANSLLFSPALLYLHRQHIPWALSPLVCSVRSQPNAECLFLTHRLEMLTCTWILLLLTLLF